MADYGAYYASGAGQQIPNQNTQQQYDPRNPQSQPRPPVAAPPPGYQQQPMGGAQQHSQPQFGQDAVNGLASQINSMDVGSAPSRSHRKKERHAYHEIGQSNAPIPQAFTTSPPPSGQFVNNAQQPRPVEGGGQPGQNMFVNPADKLRMGEEAVATQGRVDP